jgi:hypothetical protein
VAKNRQMANQIMGLQLVSWKTKQNKTKEIVKS